MGLFFHVGVGSWFFFSSSFIEGCGILSGLREGSFYCLS